MLKVSSKVSKSLLIFVCALTFWGCDNKKSSSNSNPGTSVNCLQNPYTGTCDPYAYQPYGPYGFQPYPYTSMQPYAGMPGYTQDPNSPFRYQYDYYYYGHTGPTNQLCSCPSGTRPVYNGGLGIGCAAVDVLPLWAPIYFHGILTISGPTYNNHYVNIPQVSNINGAFSNHGCFNNVAWSCLVGQANQCPSGSTCQPTAQNSPIGICIR